MWGMVARLWRGDVPLHTAFWKYAVAYGVFINVISTGGALVSYTAGAPPIFALLLFLFHIPYNLFAAIAVWRSASRYPGRQLWADLARITVAIGAVGALFI